MMQRTLQNIGVLLLYILSQELITTIQSPHQRDGIVFVFPVVTLYQDIYSALCFTVI